MRGIARTRLALKGYLWQLLDSLKWKLYLARTGHLLGFNGSVYDGNFIYTVKEYCRSS